MNVHKLQVLLRNLSCITTDAYDSVGTLCGKVEGHHIHDK
jgi:hypothetical protein